MNDTVIKNVNIYDGSGNKPYVGDIYIRNGKFSNAFPTENAVCIDGYGRCACPGFIDAHTHSDFCLGSAFNSLSRVSQGITTQIAGQCGKSAALRDAEMYEELDGDLTPLKNAGYDDPDLFQTFRGYRTYVEHLPMVENTAFLVGHGNIRQLVMGFANRAPTEDELEKMKAILREALENGAIGMSTGLIYPTGVYAKADELVALCKIVAEYDGIYTTHMRDEGSHILPAIDEAIDVARRSKCRLDISHLKVGEIQNFGKSTAVLEKIELARNSGLDIAVDQYPYSASCTGMDVLLPPWHFTEGYQALVEKLRHADFRAQVKREILSPDTPFGNTWLGCGGFSGVLVGDCPNTPEAVGKTIAQLADEWGVDDFSAYFDLMVKNDGNVLGIYFDIGEEDVQRILREPSIMVGCDSAAPVPGSSGHPRTFGSFTRVLGHYCRDLHLLPTETAIWKMTGLPAEVFRLRDKGLIAPGKNADLVLFDNAAVSDAADYTAPERLSAGIEAVLIHGEAVYENGKMTSARPGRGLYRVDSGEVIS